MVFQSISYLNQIQINLIHFFNSTSICLILKMNFSSISFKKKYFFFFYNSFRFQNQTLKLLAYLNLYFAKRNFEIKPIVLFYFFLHIFYFFKLIDPLCFDHLIYPNFNWKIISLSFQTLWKK